MDYFGVSSPNFTYGKETLNNFEDEKRKEDHERVKKEFEESNLFEDFFQEENTYDEIKNNFERNQNFFANTSVLDFSMEKIDSIPNGFNCDEKNRVFFSEEEEMCIQKNIDYLLEQGTIPMELEDKNSLKRKREVGLRKSTEPKPKRLFSNSI